jgi:hypothetical protein
MGRELKRVALDFDWPVGKVWLGYLNPYYKDHCSNCRDCAGSGYSPEAKRLSDQWYGYVDFRPEMTGSTPFTRETPAVKALALRNTAETDESSLRRWYGTQDRALAFEREADRLLAMYNTQWCHHLDAADVQALIDAGRLDRLRKDDDAPYPTSAQLNEMYLGGFGHDSINQWMCIKAKCKRLGYPETCATCKGKGSVWSSKAAKHLAKKWKRIQPPKGPGYQLWETVSEGSPVSPVFETEDAFVAYLVGEGHSEEAARKFIDAEWAPSMVMSVENGKVEIASNIDAFDTMTSGA